MLEQVARWHPEVETILSTHRRAVRASDILGLVEIESHGDPKAIGPMNYDRRGSPIGEAHGLMQVMPFHFGVTLRFDGTPSDEDRAWMLDPHRNLATGIALYVQLADRTGRTDHAAAAYFGAYNWEEMRPTNASDVTGTTGFQYIELWKRARDGYVFLDEESVWQWPIVGEITQRFGWTPHAWGHTGLDIAGLFDAEVVSPADGVVVAVRTCEPNSGGLNAWGAPIHRDDPGWEWLLDTYGSIVVIDHGEEYSFCAHTAPWINRGQQVQRGQVIGRIDNTGKTSGPHVHLERRSTRDASTPLDPLSRLSDEAQPGPIPEPIPEPIPQPEPPPPTPEPQQPTVDERWARVEELRRQEQEIDSQIVFELAAIRGAVSARVGTLEELIGADRDAHIADAESLRGFEAADRMRAANADAVLNGRPLPFPPQ